MAGGRWGVWAGDVLTWLVADGVHVWAGDVLTWLVAAGVSGLEMC